MRYYSKYLIIEVFNTSEIKVSLYKKIIDNNAGIIEKANEGLVKDIFAYYINNAISNSKLRQNDFKIDIGAGYVFFSGLEELKDLISQLIEKNLLSKIVVEDSDKLRKPIRIIMGPETTKYTKNILISIITDQVSNFSDDAIALYYKLIQSNILEIRAIYDKKFHAKIYLFYKGNSFPEDIWVGSANLTKEGFTENIELMVPVLTTNEIKKNYSKWFSNLWHLASSDLELLKIIDNVIESKYLYLHPSIFFAKLIKFMKKEYLIKEFEYNEDILVNFQNLSYFIVMERLQRYGGYMLANSVGTGKSFIACKTMKSYNQMNNNQKCLLIYPPRLNTEWNEYLAEFGLTERVDLISRGLLQKKPFEKAIKEGFSLDDTHVFDHRSFTEKYSLIVVDEAHHFRNSSNRRSNLLTIIKSNMNASVLLLTATPVNLSSKDMFSLIDLFYIGNNISKFEAEGFSDLYNSTKRKLKENGYLINKSLLKNIKKIQHELMLKLSWQIIQEFFEQDLKLIAGDDAKFEEPNVVNCKYYYPNEYKTNIFDKIVQFLYDLNYEPAKLWDGEYKDDKNLIFWYKWQLYKRLESSIYAFYNSVQYLKIRFNFYLDALTNFHLQLKIKGEPNYIYGKGFRNWDLINKHRVDAMIDTYRKLSKENQERITNNLKDDIEKINVMEKQFNSILNQDSDNDIIFARDTKLEKLIEILNENIKMSKPTLVFSQYKDTVEYLFLSLETKFKKIDFIHGSSKKSKDLMIQKFQDGAIDVLITTDFLSEGVNIPRAVSVINFDLPYNPVTLLQRSGRALRITNPKKLFIYNFTPEEDIDKELELYTKLDLRLSTILDITGLDFLIWMIDIKQIEEIKENEKKQYLNLYEEYKNLIASNNPDEFFEDSIPAVSEFDNNLRKVIEKYKITSSDLELVSKNINKPIYTVLSGNIEPFLVFKVGSKIKIINDLPNTFYSPVLLNTSIEKSDVSQITQKIQDVKKLIELERSTRILSPRVYSEIRTTIKQVSDRVKRTEIKEVFHNLSKMITEKWLLPEDFEKTRNYIHRISKIPSFLANEDFENELITNDMWIDIQEISKRKTETAQIELKAFIKYVNED